MISFKQKVCAILTSIFSVSSICFANSENVTKHFFKVLKRELYSRLRKNQTFENPQECLDAIHNVYADLIYDEENLLKRESESINKGIVELEGLCNQINDERLNFKKWRNKWKQFLSIFNYSLWHYYDLLDACIGKGKDIFEIIQHGHHYLNKDNVDIEHKSIELNIVTKRLVRILEKLFYWECEKINCKNWLIYVSQNSSLNERMIKESMFRFPVKFANNIDAVAKVSKWYEQLHGDSDDKYSLLIDDDVRK